MHDRVVARRQLDVPRGGQEVRAALRRLRIDRKAQAVLGTGGHGGIEALHRLACQRVLAGRGEHDRTLVDANHVVGLAVDQAAHRRAAARTVNHRITRAEAMAVAKEQRAGHCNFDFVERRQRGLNLHDVHIARRVEISLRVGARLGSRARQLHGGIVHHIDVIGFAVDQPADALTPAVAIDDPRAIAQAVRVTKPDRAGCIRQGNGRIERQRGDLHAGTIGDVGERIGVDTVDRYRAGYTGLAGAGKACRNAQDLAGVLRDHAQVAAQANAGIADVRRGVGAYDVLRPGPGGADPRLRCRKGHRARNRENVRGIARNDTEIGKAVELRTFHVRAGDVVDGVERRAQRKSEAVLAALLRRLLSLRVGR